MRKWEELGIVDIDNLFKTFHCITEEQYQEQNSYQEKYGHFHLNPFQVMASFGTIRSFAEKWLGNRDGAFGGTHIT